MGRVINTNGVGKQRKQLLRAIVLALRELALQKKPDGRTRDIVAFIILALNSVTDTVDRTVGPWEKRGYWLKADRFRYEWSWTERHCATMQQALLSEDWQSVAETAALISSKLQDVKLPARHHLGTPWNGAWDKFQAELPNAKPR